MGEPPSDVGGSQDRVQPNLVTFPTITFRGASGTSTEINKIYFSEHVFKHPSIKVYIKLNLHLKDLELGSLGYFCPLN